MTIITGGSLENHLLQPTLAYANRGWHVLPLHEIREGQCSCGKNCGNSKGKHPRTRRGLKDATVNEATIKGWWKEWPSANIGIRTGIESDVFMLGPDGEAGIAALADLERQFGPLPPTPRVRSGGGGQHYYFRWPVEGGIKTGANINGLPIDVRGADGIAVTPPSAHFSGNPYTWEVSPEEAPVADAPAWLLEWLRKGKGTTRKRKTGDERTKKTNQITPDAPVMNGKLVFTVMPDRSADVQARAVAYLNKCAPAVSGQGGHNQTFDTARAIVYGFDLGSAAGFDLLQQHYNPRCQPPWSEAELRHKCKEADEKPFDKPRGWLLEDGHQTAVVAGVHSFIRPPEAATRADEAIESLPIPEPPPWPTLPPAALYGLAGEIVRTIEPQTESDPVAILGQLLVASGNAIGRGPFFPVEGDRHHANLFLNTVGKSGHGRKGTAWSRVKQMMQMSDPDWMAKCVRSGLASGEGLIHFVRDAVWKMNEEGEYVIVDEGVKDKRLFVVETEFAQVLRVLRREGNTLSGIIRMGWDTGTLSTLTRNSPLQATDAHISTCGHITLAELNRYLDQTEMFNGFANRYLWVLVKRSKLLPDGGRNLNLSALGVRLQFAFAAARNVGMMTRGEAASKLWHEVYPQLTADRYGLYGAVTGRAEAQTLRLSMLYALLDGQGVIDEQHLRAALALWSYAEASAKIIFGGEVEDPLVVQVLAKLKEAGSAGMTRTDLHRAFSRNIAAALLIAALAKLRDRGDAYVEKTKTGKPGAPAERWYARRENEVNELTRSPQSGHIVEIDSFNSFIRSPSPENPVVGAEEVTL